MTKIKPVKLYEWQNYQPYSNKEQLKLQRDALTFTRLSNRDGNHISFIYSDEISRLSDAVTDMLTKIPVVGTETVLETEIFYTTKIEGAKTTRKRTSEIHSGAPIRDNDYSEQMVKNCFGAVKYLNLHGNRLSEQILLTAWQILTENACENTSLGANGYRTSSNIQVGMYTPAPFTDVPTLMRKFIEFYNSQDMNDLPIIKAILMHYAFETIHPFCDGNGRLGRLLLNNYLIGRGFETVRAVSFSMAIDKTHALYDAAFVKSENIYNDCTPLIQYMLSDVMYNECARILDEYTIVSELYAFSDLGNGNRI